MDVPLKNGLWDAINHFFIESSGMVSFWYVIWTDFFKKTENSFQFYTPTIQANFFSMKWYEVYDFIEFVCKQAYKTNKSRKAPTRARRTLPLRLIRSQIKPFTAECNRILEREVSAWRVTDGKVTRITSEPEMKSVEAAMRSKIAGIAQHITSATELLYDRKNPDYKNSIKDSISAVESICAIITKQNAPILSKALDKIEKKNIVNLHPALKAAFEKLYGYTSSGSGIRHANIRDDEITFELAQFFLIACSAFTNYLIGLATKKGISLEKTQ